MGDYLLARAICLASSLDDNFACRAISESARHMCEGELRQIESRGNYDLSEADYFEIIAGKTAALTACCCRLGAHYAGAEPAVCEALARYGHDLGVAFQIADDVLDLVGEEAAVGKSLGTDLLKQKATLPLIRLLGTVSPSERAELTVAAFRDPATITATPCGRGSSGTTRFPTPGSRPGGSRGRRAGSWRSCPPRPPADRCSALTDFVVNRQQ